MFAHAANQWPSERVMYPLNYLCSHRRITLGKHFALTSSDSFKLGAYRADPAGTAKGGIVVIQEIFGVNHHIRAVCDRLAGARLYGAGARRVRPSAAELRVRLHA